MKTEISKILLIEDRTERQEKFTQDTGIDLKEYADADIIDNHVSLDKTQLEKYSTIITHRSAFGGQEDNVLDFLKHHCAETNTKLVFFSGGISSTYYSKTKYEFLLLNSKSFYSQNLKLFLDDAKDTENEVNILLLGYGKNWKINLLLNTLAKINLFISNNKSKPKVKFNNFKTITKIDNIKPFIDFEYPYVEKGGVNLEDLQNFADTITMKVENEVELYA